MFLFHWRWDKLHQMFFLAGALLTVSPHFQYQNEKLLAQPTRIFPTLKISFFAIFLLRIWRNSSKNISRAISLTLTDTLTYFYSSGSLHRDVQQPMLVPAGGLKFLNFTNCHVVVILSHRHILSLLPQQPLLDFMKLAEMDQMQSVQPTH